MAKVRVGLTTAENGHFLQTYARLFAPSEPRHISPVRTRSGLWFLGTQSPGLLIHLWRAKTADVVEMK